MLWSYKLGLQLLTVHHLVGYGSYKKLLLKLLDQLKYIFLLNWQHIKPFNYFSKLFKTYSKTVLLKVPISVTSCFWFYGTLQWTARVSDKHSSEPANVKRGGKSGQNDQNLKWNNVSAGDMSDKIKASTKSRASSHVWGPENYTVPPAIIPALPVYKEGRTDGIHIRDCHRFPLTGTDTTPGNFGNHHRHTRLKPTQQLR